MRTVPAQQWARIELDVDYAAKRIVLTLDGQVVIDEATTVDCPYTGRPAAAQVGLYCVPNTASAITVRYDDVVFDVR